MKYEPFDRVAVTQPSRRAMAGFVLIALVIGELSLFVHPTGFAGGPSDDQRYLDIALAWWRSGPSAGTTHWALRMPLIVAIDAAFRLAGPSLAALLAVPRLFYALFVASTAAAMTRWAGMRAAWIWLALVVTSPVLHEMATSCFPEILELALGTSSLIAFAAGRQAVGGWRRAGWLAVAGLSLGLAILVRETAAFLVPGYLWLAVRRPAGSRAAYLALAVGVLLPPLADVSWLWWLSGDWLYRLHVDANHVHIYSAYLKGGVFTGGLPFLNPALARLWIPAGPTRIHWTINPLGDFLIDPAFGFVIVACLLLAIPAVRGRRPLTLPAGMVPVMLAIAIGCYLTVTWVFTLRPQPRYYLPVAAAAQVGAAVALAAMLRRPDTRRRAWIVLVPVLAAGAFTILTTRDAGWQAETAVPYMAAHPGAYAAEPNIAGRIAYRATIAGAAPAIVGTPPVGGYRITEAGSPDWQAAGGMRPQPGYREVALLPVRQPALYLLLHPQYWRAMRIEQRVR